MRRALLLVTALAAATACNLAQITDSSGPDETVASVGPSTGGTGGDGGNGGGGSSFSYTERPNAYTSDDWGVQEARKTDTGVWVLYTGDSRSVLARYDWSTRQWSEWSYPEFIYDFDVPRTGDQGDYAVLLRRKNAGYEAFTTTGQTLDIQVISQSAGKNNLGVVGDAWGSGSAAGSNWLAESGGPSSIWVDNGTGCCPQGWDHAGEVPGTISNLWASRRSDGFALVAASGLYIAYNNAVASLGIGGDVAVAFDVSNGVPWVLSSDAGLYRITANPNGRNGSAQRIADLTSYSAVGLFFPALDMEGDRLFGPRGLMIDTNGSVTGSWIGKVDLTNQTQLGVATGVVNAAAYIFKNPRDDSVLVFAHVTDLSTFQSRQSWFEVTVAGTSPYKDPMMP